MRFLWAGAIVAAVAGLGPVVARAAFEDIEISPRVRAMGGSWAALSGDPFAAFHNPAGLAWARGLSGAASYVRPFGYDFSSQSALAGTARLPEPLGAASLGVRRFGVDYRDQSLTRELTLSLAHGLRLRSDLQSEVAVGWAMQVYHLDYGPSVSGIDPGSASAVGIGLGAEAVLRERTRVGFHVLNLNNPRIGTRDHEELRRRLSLGVSYAPYPGVQTVLDLSNELGEAVQYRGGTEFEMAEFLWLRAGVSTEPSTFTAGLGLRWAGVTFDYGFSTGGGVLDETHQFGLAFTWPGASAEAQ
jgi:hypothetical protein